MEVKELLRQVSRQTGGMTFVLRGGRVQPGPVPVLLREMAEEVAQEAGVLDGILVVTPSGVQVYPARRGSRAKA